MSISISAMIGIDQNTYVPAGQRGFKFHLEHISLMVRRSHTNESKLKNQFRKAGFSQLQISTETKNKLEISFKQIRMGKYKFYFSFYKNTYIIDWAIVLINSAKNKLAYEKGHLDGENPSCHRFWNLFNPFLPIESRHDPC